MMSTYIHMLLFLWLQSTLQTIEVLDAIVTDWIRVCKGHCECCRFRRWLHCDYFSGTEIQLHMERNTVTICCLKQKNKQTKGTTCTNKCITKYNKTIQGLIHGRTTHQIWSQKRWHFVIGNLELPGNFLLLNMHGQSVQQWVLLKDAPHIYQNFTSNFLILSPDLLENPSMLAYLGRTCLDVF